MTSQFKKLTDYKWLNLFEINNDEEGKPKNWMMTSRKPDPKGKADKPDAVVICATQWTKDNLNTVVLKQWRPPIDGYEYEFPAGLIDEGETIEEAAKREFWEETGLNITKITSVSPNIFASSGMTDESCVIVFCEFDGEISTANQEADENIHVEIFNIEKLKKLYGQEGEFQNAKISAKAWLMMDNIILLEHTRWM